MVLLNVFVARTDETISAHYFNSFILSSCLKNKRENAAPKFRCCKDAGENCEVKAAVFYGILFGTALFLIRSNDQLF